MLELQPKWRWTDCTFDDFRLTTITNIALAADGEPLVYIVTTAGFFPDDLGLQFARDYANRWTNPVASFYRDCLATIDSERYFSGPIINGVFTEYSTADEALLHAFVASQEMNILLSRSINVRSVRLFHCSQKVKYTLREFLPHRVSVPQSAA